MDPIIGASLLTAGSSLLTNMWNSQNAADANSAARQNAREQMNFQREMSNTAHQRATADLRAAGLNPILAAGSAASSPSGSQAPVVKAEVEDSLSKGVNTALEARRLKKELDATDSQLALNVAAQKNQEAQAMASLTSAKKAATEQKALEVQLPAIQQRSKLNLKRDKIDEEMVVPDAILNRTGEATGIIGNLSGLSRFLPRKTPKQRELESFQKERRNLERDNQIQKETTLTPDDLKKLRWWYD